MAKKNTHRLRPHWKPKDEEVLRFLWETPATIRELCTHFGRSAQGICRRAVKLGLPPRVPNGFEFLTHAAMRTGFDIKTFRNVLLWARVKIHIVRRYKLKRKKVKNRKRKFFHQCYVNPLEVDEAVGRWMNTETPATAAPRFGVDATTLRRWLRNAGIKRKPERHCPWRIDSKIIERVVYEHCEAML